MLLKYSLPFATFIIGIALGFFDNSLLLCTSTARPISPTVADKSDATSTYLNSVYHFSLAYPSDLHVSEFADPGGPTILFDEPSGHAGFQIFVLPSNTEPLSPRELVREFPALKTGDIANLVVGTSTQAFAFTNDIPGIGTMREFWFSHGGIRYEIVTFPYLDDWLAQILASLKFDVPTS